MTSSEVFIIMSKGEFYIDLSWVRSDVKSASMTALHPFSTPGELIAPSLNPSTPATDLYVLRHKIRFTNIQPDDFTGMLTRSLERLEMEGTTLKSGNGS